MVAAVPRQAPPTPLRQVSTRLFPLLKGGDGGGYTVTASFVRLYEYSKETSKDDEPPGRNLCEALLVGLGILHWDSTYENTSTRIRTMSRLSRPLTYCTIPELQCGPLLKPRGLIKLVLKGLLVDIVGLDVHLFRTFCARKKCS